MKIRLGYDITMTHPQYTPMLLLLNIHQARSADILKPDILVTEPAVPYTQFHDSFGNLATRLIAPPGQIRFKNRCADRRSRHLRCLRSQCHPARCCDTAR